MKVLNFGSLNIDYVYDVENFVKKGETISSKELNVFSGGKGLNQSIAFARAGANIYHAGIIGEDGKFLIDLLREAGADVSNVLISREIRTGNAIIQRDSSGDNCIILFGGANRSIDKDYADKVISGFEKGDYIVLQNEISELAYIVERAHKQGMKIVLNPSPMDENIDRLNLELVDYFLLNETEAMKLTGSDCEDFEKQIKELSEKFKKAGILITLGEKGSMYYDGKTLVKEAAIKTEVVDTTAAGDTFTGYFISSVIEGIGIEEALKRATAAASITVSGMGAAPSIPHRKEVDEKLGKL